MSKEWLGSYPEGTPAEVDIQAYSSLVDVFNQSCNKFSHNPAFTNFGTQISYSELELYSRNLAAFLQHKLGMRKGEKIAIMMPNLLQNPVSIFSALRAGLIVVNTNPLYTADELKHQLNDSGATTIIILEKFAHVLESVLEETQVKNVIITKMGDMLPFPKSIIINAVVKHIKKMVPAFNIKNHICFKQALVTGNSQTYTKPDINLDDFAFLQ